MYRFFTLTFAFAKSSFVFCSKHGQDSLSCHPGGIFCLTNLKHVPVRVVDVTTCVQIILAANFRPLKVGVGRP